MAWTKTSNGVATDARLPPGRRTCAVRGDDDHRHDGAGGPPTSRTTTASASSVGAENRTRTPGRRSVGIGPTSAPSNTTVVSQWVRGVQRGEHADQTVALLGEREVGPRPLRHVVAVDDRAPRPACAASPRPLRARRGAGPAGPGSRARRSRFDDGGAGRPGRSRSGPGRPPTEALRQPVRQRRGVDERLKIAVAQGDLGTGRACRERRGSSASTTRSFWPIRCSRLFSSSALRCSRSPSCNASSTWRCAASTARWVCSSRRRRAPRSSRSSRSSSRSCGPRPTPSPSSAADALRRSARAVLESPATRRRPRARGGPVRTSRPRPDRDRTASPPVGRRRAPTPGAEGLIGRGFVDSLLRSRRRSILECRPHLRLVEEASTTRCESSRRTRSRCAAAGGPRPAPCPARGSRGAAAAGRAPRRARAPAGPRSRPRAAAPSSASGSGGTTGSLIARPSAGPQDARAAGTP